MTNTPGGADWWVASDGRWYPPHAHPSRRPPSPPWSLGTRGWALALGVLTVAVLALAGVAAGRAGENEAPTRASAGPPSVSGPPTPGRTPAVPPTAGGPPPTPPIPDPPVVPSTPIAPGVTPDPALRNDLTAVLRDGADVQGIPLTDAEAGCVADVLLEVFGAAAMRDAIDTGGASFDALTRDEDPARVLAFVNGVLGCAPQLVGQ